MNFSKLLAKPLVFGLTLWSAFALIVYVLINSLIMPYLAGKFTGTVAVPALTGLAPEQAKNILSQNHLLFMLDSTGDYSQNIKAGLVQGQYPLSGATVKKGRRVWIKISKGFKSEELPSLKGLSLRQAEITLQQLGLRLGQVSYLKQSNIPAGAVIASHPAAHALLEKGHAVNLEISEGKEEQVTKLPDFKGQSLTQTKMQLLKLRLRLGKVTYQKQKKSLPNTILSQTPMPGSKMNGTMVDLMVSQ